MTSNIRKRTGDTPTPGVVRQVVVPPCRVKSQSPTAPRVALDVVLSADSENPQSVSEYEIEIVNSFFREEASFMPRPSYMETQSDINGKMRAILIDWLIEVHMKYKMQRETIYLTVNLIDRYLSRMSVLRKRLQLVGVVAMFIAAKFEEITPPEVGEFVYITDNAYTKEDLFVMECTMLTTLCFQMVVPTASHFLDRLMRANSCDTTHQELVHYIMELSLLDLRMIRHVPSFTVSAAILLSNELMGRKNVWPATMMHYSRLAAHALRGCAEEMRVLLDAAPTSNMQAVAKKYMLPLHCGVANMSFSSPRLRVST